MRRMLFPQTILLEKRISQNVYGSGKYRTRMGKIKIDSAMTAAKYIIPNLSSKEEVGTFIIMNCNKYKFILQVEKDLTY